MVFFNWATMQMAAKIVYYGPGLCGKTSNLSYIYAKTAPSSRGEMVSLETESDRTLFFDLLPIEVGTIGGFKTRLQLYTVPGQVFYNTTRKLVLKGVDGLVFVADSQRPMREANVESFESLRENLRELGLEIAELPVVLQYNKRDLANILSIEELNTDLNPHGSFPVFEASAVNGEGVITTLKEITKLTLKKLRARMNAPETGPRVGAAQPSPAGRGVRAPQPAPSISARSLARAAEEGVAVAPRGAAPVLSSPAAVAGLPGVAPLRNPGGGDVAEPRAQPVTAPRGGRVPPDREPIRAPTPPVAADDEPIAVAIDVGTPTGPPPAPPPVKRVQVSSHMDILGELDELRKQATMSGRGRSFATTPPDIDIDSLLSSTSPRTCELRERLETAVNSDIFKRMRVLQLAIRIQGENGTTIHTFDPVSLTIDDAEGLKKILLRFSLDLENLR
jgi:signal recognition particle receptor subunit beta